MRSWLAIATLALGVGASTAIFSFVNPLLLHPFTYPRAGRLVFIQEVNPKGNPATGVSYAAYRDWTTQRNVIPQLSVFGIGFFFLTGVHEPEQIAGALVTPNTFRTLGAAPALGRDFRDGEEGVVILSDACWRRRFGADRNILGRTIALDWARTPEVERYTVIGVMPPRFWMYYSGFEVFVALPRSAITDSRQARYLTAIGRLAEGASVQQAHSALNALPNEKDWSVLVRSWERASTEPLRSELLVLAGGAALLLLIASANVAGLLLVRAQARRREIAIRAALGARPWTLVALLVRESLRLGLTAGVLGMGLAWCGVRAILALRPADLYIMQLSPGLDRIAINPAALVFAVGAALIACLLAGIFPALQARKVDVACALKDAGSPNSQRSRKILVAAEVALSVLLLAGAGLLIKTLQRIQAVDLGYRPNRVLAMRLPVPKGQATDAARTEAYFRDVLNAVTTLPQVQDAALGEKLPDSADTLPSEGRGSRDFAIPGRADPIRARYNFVSSGYFSTLGIPLLRGRFLTEQDRRRVVISESLARLGWPKGDPVGQQIDLRGEALEIVGVAGDVQNLVSNVNGDRSFNRWVAVYRLMRDEPPLAQYFLAVRTVGNPLLAAGSIREVVRGFGGVVAELDTMERFVKNTTWQNEQAAGLVGTFAALALILSAVGLYGVISFAVARRTREIGIRVAVGARRPDVIGLVLAESAGPVVAGIVLGLAAAAAMGRLLGNLLYRVAPADPSVLVSVAAAIVLAALCASLVPLLRALKVDPTIALRAD